MKHRSLRLMPFLLAALVSAGQAQTVKSAEGQVSFRCPLPQSDESITVLCALPEGWQRNTGFGTVVYEPGNAGDYYEAPQIEFQALCEGEARARAIPQNIEGYIRRLKEGWKKLATGNAALDTQGALVEILKETRGEGERLLIVKLTYPEGVSPAMYPPRCWIYRFLYSPDDPWFLLIKGMVPVALAGEHLTPVETACLGTVIQ